MRYPAYPEYKNADIEWLKDIPKGWSEKRLRFVVRTNPVKSEINNLEDDDLVSFVPMEAVGEFGGISLEREKLLFEVYNGYTYFRNGDIVIAKITPCFENGKGAIAEGLKNGIGFGTTEFHVLRPDIECSTRFMFYLSMSHPFRKIGESGMLGAGGQKRISESFIKDFRIGLPGKKDQEFIADFLDYNTQQIDQLIEKKKALIEKLNEQRIAVITQAVTKGLDKAAKMKPSGVDWLGDVPEHWGSRKLKFLTDCALQYGANEAAVLDDRDLPRFIRITDVKDDGSLHDDTFRSLPEDIAEPFLLEEGDILLARSGATVGKSFKYSKSWGKAAFAGYLIKFSVNKEIMDEDYAYLYFQSSVFWANINSTLIQSTIQNFSAEKYANIVQPLPDLEEQKKIVSYLSASISKIDKMKNKAQCVIEKLEEYRSSLITAAVTGKIDVRNFEIIKGVE